MGQSVENISKGTMRAQVVLLCTVLFVVSCQKVPHNLPVLFQYADQKHNVAVFRGAELKQAIAAGLVPGFGNLGREGKKIDTTADDRAAAEAAARAAAEARARAAAAQAAAAARPSQLERAEQACVQACRNLAGQCRNPFV